MRRAKNTILKHRAYTAETVNSKFMVDWTVLLRSQRYADFRVVTKKSRVFFANEKDALAAGYRPCGNCLREKYKEYMSDPQKYREKYGL